jgi:hypothetical protein
VDVFTSAQYTVTLTNRNDYDVSFDALQVDLSEALAFLSGSASGLTTENPISQGVEHTFEGPFEVPAESTAELRFSFEPVRQEPGEFPLDVTLYPLSDKTPELLEAAVLSLVPVTLFEGWNLLPFWAGSSLVGVPAVIAGLDAAVEPAVWDSVARNVGGSWLQTFRNAPLPSFNTLGSLEEGIGYWIFVAQEAQIIFPD